MIPTSSASVKDRLARIGYRRGGEKVFNLIPRRCRFSRGALIWGLWAVPVRSRSIHRPCSRVPAWKDDPTIPCGVVEVCYRLLAIIDCEAPAASSGHFWYSLPRRCGPAKRCHVSNPFFFALFLLGVSHTNPKRKEETPSSALLRSGWYCQPSHRREIRFSCRNGSATRQSHRPSPLHRQSRRTARCCRSCSAL